MSYYFLPGVMYKRWKQVNKLRVSRDIQLANVESMAEVKGIDTKQTHYSVSTKMSHFHIKEIEKKDSELIVHYKTKVNRTYKLYKVLTRQYLGLGAILQFIPGTNANHARHRLSEELRPVIQLLRIHVGETGFFEPDVQNKDVQQYQNKHESLSLLNSYFNASSVHALIGEIINGYYNKYTQSNTHWPLLALLVYLPVVYDLALPFILNHYFKTHKKSSSLLKQGLFNLIHSVFNPLRILQTLIFIPYVLISRFLEIGSESPVPSRSRLALKTINGAIFGTILVPIILLKFAVELPLSLIQMALISPLVHVLKSLSSAIQYRNHELVVTSIDDFKNWKSSTLTMNDKLVMQHFGLRNKELLPSMEEKADKPPRMMALRVPKEIRGLQFLRLFDLKAVESEPNRPRPFSSPT